LDCDTHGSTNTQSRVSQLGPYGLQNGAQDIFLVLEQTSTCGLVSFIRRLLQTFFALVLFILNYVWAIS